MLYLIANAPNRLDRRDRAIGWERMRPEREARKVLTEAAIGLKDKGITEVWASDLDKDSAAIVAQELHCGVRAEFQLRRFNVGRSHGAPLTKVESILTDLLPTWEKNPDIPIRGGDSLTSYRKRMEKMYEALIVKDCIALVTDLQTIRYWRDRDPHALIRNGNPVHYGHVYCMRKIEE